MVTDKTTDKQFLLIDNRFIIFLWNFHICFSIITFYLIAKYRVRYFNPFELERNQHWYHENFAKTLAMCTCCHSTVDQGPAGQLITPLVITIAAIIASTLFYGELGVNIHSASGYQQQQGLASTLYQGINNTRGKYPLRTRVSTTLGRKYPFRTRVSTTLGANIHSVPGYQQH